MNRPCLLAVVACLSACDPKPPKIEGNTVGRYFTTQDMKDMRMAADFICKKDKLERPQSVQIDAWIFTCPEEKAP